MPDTTVDNAAADGALTCSNGCCFYYPGESRWFGDCYCGGTCQCQPRNFCPVTGDPLPDTPVAGESLTKIMSGRDQWAEHHFPGAQPWEALIGLQEELGELSHAYLKRHQGIRTQSHWYGYREKQIQDAVGDVFLYLAEFCRLEGITLLECVRMAWDDVQQRDWVRNPAGGEQS